MTTPTRPALPAADRPARRSLRALWQRDNGAKVVARYPVRTEPVIGNAAEVAAALRGPAVINHGRVRRLPDGRVRVDVTFTDYAHPINRPPRITVNTGPLATLTRIGGIIVGAITALYAAGQIVWILWGAQIAAALQIAAVFTIGAGIVVVVWWFLNHGRNGCPGLHCQGCGGH